MGEKELNPALRGNINGGIPLVDLHLTEPAAQRLGCAANFLGFRLDGSPLRQAILSVLLEPGVRLVPGLLVGIDQIYSFLYRSILSKNRASVNPGAIHTSVRLVSVVFTLMSGRWRRHFLFH